MRKLNKFLLVVIALTIVAMTVGYSALNSSLNITGEVNYRAQDDTRITGFTANSKPSQMTIEYSDYSKHEVKLGYTTTGACSITYTVEVKNSSGVNMGILSIGGTDDDVVVQSDVIGKKLVGPASTSTFTITFNSTTPETKTYLLTFNFKQIFTITYNGFSNTESYKKEIFEGEEFYQNFGSNVPKSIEVTMGGVALENYNYSNGTLTIMNVTGNLVINGIFAPSFTDSCDIHPNEPILNGDMIPVVYDEDKEVWVKQDLDKSYDYCNQIWANAVTVTESSRNYYKNEATVGTEISMSDINTMWVWIPRYSYTIKSEDGGSNYFGKASFGNSAPARELPGEIDVKFIENGTEKGVAQYVGNSISGWRTNEAFNFGGVSQAGIWVGKFETTGSLSTSGQACENTNCNVSNVTIKPGKKSLVYQTVSSFYYMSRSMQVSYADTYGFDESNGNLHMMKNDEWGAVAYLSQSKYGKYGNSDYTGANKEIYENNDIDNKTGHSGGGPSASYNATKYEYNDMTNLGPGQGQAGPGASTTGNIYGIYDMSGGEYEYVMGILEYDAQGEDEHSGQIVTGSSGFKGLSSSGSATGSYDLPNEKYYNKYKSAEPTSSSFLNVNLDSACNGGKCYGHALGETHEASSEYYGWYSDSAIFVNRSGPWFMRGDLCTKSTAAGVFSAYDVNGNYSSNYSCRLAFAP